MKCIFCLEERSPSEEHVFPLAIGGCLVTNRVCKVCNDMLGHKVDAGLSDNLLIRLRRAQLGLAGNSGKPPPLHEILLGKHPLVNDPEHYVRTTFNAVTGKLEAKTNYRKTVVTMPDGTMAHRIIVDESDRDELPKILQRERKRLGLPPLAQEDLMREIEKITQNPETIENPTFNVQLTFGFKYLRHAMMKIAYELAFLWLGELYLDDPHAALLREAICNPDPKSADTVQGYVGDVESAGDTFQFWASNTTDHLAFAFPDNKIIAIMIRIFDIYAAIIPVTDNAMRYLSGAGSDEKLRFISMRPGQGQMVDVPVMQGLMQAASLLTKGRHGSHG